jgi:hypothetical protein
MPGLDMSVAVAVALLAALRSRSSDPLTLDLLRSDLSHESSAKIARLVAATGPRILKTSTESCRTCDGSRSTMPDSRRCGLVSSGAWRRPSSVSTPFDGSSVPWHAVMFSPCDP